MEHGIEPGLRLIAHNLGVIDRKHLENANTHGNEGADLPISIPEAERALEIVVRVFQVLCTPAVLAP